MKNQMTKKPLLLSMDLVNSEESSGHDQTVASSNSQFLQESSELNFVPLPFTTRHGASKTQSGIDISKVFKNPASTNLQKPQLTMSDPKVTEFFKKVSAGGFQSQKSY